MKNVLVTAPEKEMDPNLLLLDGRDIRSVNRRERRRHGFRGPAFTQPAPFLTRFMRRHADDARVFSPKTRRQRRQRARIRRDAAARGMA